MNLRVVAVLAAALLLPACADAPSLGACSCDADCGAGNACYAGTCVVNAPPSADFEPPTGAETHRVLSLVAATSDPEGGAVATRWSFRPVAGGCDVDAEPASGGTVEVVFWCSGTYEATVVPIDPAGLEGAPAARAFAVAPSEGAPSVAAGAPIQARHRCDLGVPRCAVLGPDGAEGLSLEASATDPDGGTLRFEWRALPPAAVGADPSLRVTLLPDPVAPRPRAAIENGGGAIAGTWRFRVRAIDPGGLVGQAWVIAEVANEAPVATPTAASLPHTHAGGIYAAEGEAAVLVVDPDGDAVTLTATLPSPAPPSCTEGLERSERGFRVAIACTDPSDLIGPTPRTLLVRAADVHGAELHLEIPVAVENRPPVVHLAGGIGLEPLELDHSSGPCALADGSACFLAEGTDPFLVFDPDGDPLGGYAFTVAVAGDRPSAAGAAWLEGGLQRFRFEAPVGRPLDFRSADGSSGFALSALARDPWTASAPTVLPIRIRNRPPAVVEAGPTVSVNHRYDAAALRYHATAPGPRFADPDGDPLSASLDTTAPCQSATLDADGRAEVQCARAWDWRSTGRPPLALFAVGTKPTITVTDGWEAAGSPAPITILDRPPKLPALATSVEGCECRPGSSCPLGEEVAFPLPVTYADPDGDPARVSVWASAEVDLDTPTLGCVPEACAAAAFAEEASLLAVAGFFDDARFDVHGTITADTGSGPAASALLTATLTYDTVFPDACP